MLTYRTQYPQPGRQTREAVKAGLENGKKVAVSVRSEVQSGAPDSAKTKLR